MFSVGMTGFINRQLSKRTYRCKGKKMIVLYQSDYVRGSVRPAAAWLPPQGLFRFSLVGEGTATQTVRCSERLNFSLLPAKARIIPSYLGYFYDIAPSGSYPLRALCRR